VKIVHCGSGTEGQRKGGREKGKERGKNVKEDKER